MTQDQRWPPQRQGHAAPPEVAAVRAQIAQAQAAGTWRTDREAQSVMLGDRESLCFRAEDAAPRAAVLALHGGGFRQGAPEIAGRFHEALVRSSGVAVYALRYRLAPEHPFPSGLVDAWHALLAMQARHPDLPLIVCGDSAGGGLAAGLGVLDAQAERTLSGVILLSPWLDLRLGSASYGRNAAHDPMFSHEAASKAAALYLQGADPADPLASPVLADLSNYPATLIVVGSGEVLLDDSVAFEARLRASGRSSRLVVIDGMDHVAVTRGMDLPGSPACFDAVAAFLDEAIVAAGSSGEARR